jgi:PAS domain S-box-containing protein
MAKKSEIPKKIKSRSLAAWLITAFLSLGLFTLIVANIFSLYLNFKNQSQNISAQQLFIAQKAADTVKDFISEKFEILSHASSFGSLADASPKSQEDVLNKLFGRDGAFRQLADFDISGKEIASVSRLSTKTLIKSIENSKNDIFLQTKKGGNYIGDVYIDETTNEPMIVMAIPIINIFGDVKGILVAEVNLKFTWDLVSGIKVGDTGHAYVVDKDGNLIAHRDVSRVLKRENLSELKSVGEFVRGQKQENKTVDEISKGINGNYVVSNYVSLGSPNWAVVSEMPIWEAQAPFIQQLMSIPWMMLVGFGVAVFFGFLFSRKITKPIINLRDATKEIEAGNYLIKIEDSPYNEITELGKTFNSMSERIKTYTTGLETLVLQRTEDLNKKMTELASSNKDLEKTKSAMLNLLKDARKLEIKIEEEKSSVEKKVIERTRELKEEQARLIASINSLNFGFIVANADNRILMSNKAMMALLGLKDGVEITIDKISEILGESANIKLEINNCLKNKIPTEISEINFDKKTIRCNIAPVVMIRDHEEVIGYIFLIEDITEEKVMERSRDEFFAVASHELRTPLTAIRGNTEMMLDMYADKIADKDVKEMVKDINEASIRLIGIVNDFLDASRLEQGKITLNNTEFDLVELINNVVRVINNEAEAKSLYLKFTNEGQKPLTVFADLDKVKQILFNLIGNAIKFTVNGGITISVGVLENFVKISITDTGSGISAENEKLLFRKFQPAGEQILTRDVSKSTGLGLYISRLIISKMGGTIGLEKSVVGQGSTFVFTLPKFNSNKV